MITSYPGIFITVEGLDGSGKTTQIQHLADAFVAAGHTVRQLREPGGTALGEYLRPVIKTPHDLGLRVNPVAELLLFNAARAQLVREVIRPALERGEVVICDRFSDSSVAYQGAGRGLAIEDVTATIAIATGGLEPDATLYLQIDLATRAMRIAGRDEIPDALDLAGDDFNARVLESFEQLARSEQRVITIDATRSLELVSSDVRAAATDLMQRLS